MKENKTKTNKAKQKEPQKIKKTKIKQNNSIANKTKQKTEKRRKHTK